MSKVDFWRRKMNDYYRDITSEQLRLDLQESGFETSSSSNDDRIFALHILNEGYAEVAAASNLIEEHASKDVLLEDDPFDAVAVIIG
jgi:hypothetical protein